MLKGPGWGGFRGVSAVFFLPEGGQAAVVDAFGQQGRAEAVAGAALGEGVGADVVVAGVDDLGQVGEAAL